MQEPFEFAFQGTREEFLKVLQAIFEIELATYFEEGNSLDMLIPFEGRNYWLSGKPEAERGINGGLYRIKYEATSRPIEYETIKDSSPIILDDGSLHFLDRPANREDYGRSERGIVFDLTPIALGGQDEITKVRVSLGHEAFGIKPETIAAAFGLQYSGKRQDKSSKTTPSGWSYDYRDEVRWKTTLVSWAVDTLNLTWQIASDRVDVDRNHSSKANREGAAFSTEEFEKFMGCTCEQKWAEITEGH